jgi:hypothetical protein
MKLVPEVSLERVIRAGLPTVVPFAAKDLERTGRIIAGKKRFLSGINRFTELLQKIAMIS